MASGEDAEVRLDRLERWVTNEIQARKKDRDRIQKLEVIIDEMIVKPALKKQAQHEVVAVINKVLLTDEVVTAEEIATAAIFVKTHPENMPRCPRDLLNQVLEIIKKTGVTDATLEEWKTR